MKVKVKKTETKWPEYFSKEDLEKTVNNIMNIVDYEAIALRFDDQEYKIGEELPASKVWVDDERTDDDMSGTSTIGLQTHDDGWIGGKEINLMTYRHRPHIYLVGGDIAEYGNPAIGELILRNCKVLAKVTLFK